MVGLQGDKATYLSLAAVSIIRLVVFQAPRCLFRDRGHFRHYAMEVSRQESALMGFPPIEGHLEDALSTCEIDRN